MTNYKNNRFKEIVSIAIKYGLKNNISDPIRLRKFLEELGPTFIKIGQVMSTRPDIFPKEFIKELEKLQDDVLPQDFSVFKPILENEIGDLKNNFSFFDETPLASASLSQVYFASLHSGEKVVVKVQRPDIDKKIFADLNILKKLSPFIKFSSTASIVNVKDILNELEEAIALELDFKNESKNIKDFKEFNKDLKYISFPEVYDKLSTEKVIVMDFLSGYKIDNVDKLTENGYDLSDISTKLIYNFFKQVFTDGFFHADPHPGNILIHNKTIAYIDFGLMGKLDKRTKEQLNTLLRSAVEGDVDLMVESILDIGIKKSELNRTKFSSEIENLYLKYFNMSMGDYDITIILSEMIKICRDNNIEIPKDVTLLSKAMLTLQGVVSSIDDTISLFDIAIPFFKDKFLKDQLENISLLNGFQFLSKKLKRVSSIPDNLDQVLKKINRGELKLNFVVRNSEKTLSDINKMINRLISSIIILAILISSSLIIAANAKYNMKILSFIGITGYLISGIYGLLLLYSIYKSGMF